MPRAASDGVILAPISLSNREFLEKYARPGCVGLASGTSLVDRAIARAERHLDKNKRWGEWTHSFVFSERRSDGQLWIIESDLQFHRKHVQLGVQENRSSKYHDEEIYTCLGIVDFQLSEDLTQRLLVQALDQLADRTRYSVRELLGTLVALRRPDLRERTNVLAREHCFYCSAFVQYLFRHIGVDLAPGIDIKNTTPEDLARSAQPHRSYFLQREVPTSQFGNFTKGTARRIHVRWRATRRKRRGRGESPAERRPPIPSP